MGVVTLLPRELANLLLQSRVIDCMLEGSHRVDEILLAIREHRRKRIEEVCETRAFRVPVFSERMAFECKAHAAKSHVYRGMGELQLHASKLI
jgi:hypothetical protein